MVNGRTDNKRAAAHLMATPSVLPCVFLDLLCMILSENDSGRTIQMKVGEVVAVRLKENSSTGYRWTAESAFGLEQIEDRFEGGREIGAAGLRMLRFRIMRIGSYELRMKNWREWEGESSVLARFIVKIIVRT